MTREYENYLNGVEWAEKRKRRLAIGKWRCAACGCGVGLQVHHLTYARIFREDMEDLLPLCRRHHEVAERLVKDGKVRRSEDVLFLATETVRLINEWEVREAARIDECRRLEESKRGEGRRKKGERKFRAMVNGMIARHPIQVELLNDMRFVKLLGLGHEEFRRALNRLYDGDPRKGKLMGNGFGIWCRENRKGGL